MIQQAINEAVEKRNLQYDTAADAMREIMQGLASQAQIAAFLTALRMKGESVDEIIACASVMREYCTHLPHDMEVVEIVGTGGDKSNTFNISTVSAFVIAAAGTPVAKHGNRSVSSKCGAADVLESLGAKLDISAAQSADILKKTGICFMFAPGYHASMKHAMPVRKELGIRTIFNILGPLTNPAGAKIQLLGVYDKALIEPLANVLRGLGVRRAMVVHGNDGLDEITLTTTTKVCELNNGELKHYTLDPHCFNFDYCSPADLLGGSAERNAQIAREVLNGETGAKRNTVLLNAAACLYMSGKAASFADGIALAAKTIDSGAALSKMEEFVKATNETVL